jgi:RNase P/RNase MRP subunit p29
MMIKALVVFPAEFRRKYKISKILKDSLIIQKKVKKPEFPKKKVIMEFRLKIGEKIAGIPAISMVRSGTVFRPTKNRFKMLNCLSLNSIFIPSV